MERGDKRQIERCGAPVAWGRDELEIRLDHHAAGKLDAMEAPENRLVNPLVPARRSRVRRGRARRGVDRGIVRELRDPAEEPTEPSGGDGSGALQTTGNLPVSASANWLNRSNRVSLALAPPVVSSATLMPRSASSLRPPEKSANRRPSNAEVGAAMALDGPPSLSLSSSRAPRMRSRRRCAQGSASHERSASGRSPCRQARLTSRAKPAPCPARRREAAARFPRRFPRQTRRTASRRDSPRRRARAR